MGGLFVVDFDDYVGFCVHPPIHTLESGMSIPVDFRLAYDAMKCCVSFSTYLGSFDFLSENLVKNLMELTRFGYQHQEL